MAVLDGNAAGCLAGLGLAAIGSAGGLFSGGIDGLIQNGISLTGTALMCWYVVQLHKELRLERKERREENQARRKEHQEDKRMYYELVQAYDAKCHNCKLARNSNDLTEAAQDMATQIITNKFDPPNIGRTQ